MKTKNIISFGLATLISITIVGAASAGETLADRNEFNFNAPLTKADIAAKNFVYDTNYWEQAATLIEDSDDLYNFNRPETEAEIAAKNHHYNKEILKQVGTEGGLWEYNPAQQTNRTLAEGAKQKGLCSKC